VGKPRLYALCTPEIRFIISGITKCPANIIPKNETETIILDIVLSEIFFSRPSMAEVKIIKNIPNPYQQAGCPRKYGQGSLKAQVEVKSFIALKYPENNNPASPRKNIVFK